MSNRNVLISSIELNFTIMLCIPVTIVTVNAIPLWIISYISKIRRKSKCLLNLLLSHFVVGLRS